MTKTTPKWEIKFDKQFGDLEYRLDAIKTKIPINTKEGVVDLGTAIAIELSNQMKHFIRQVVIPEALVEFARKVRMEKINVSSDAGYNQAIDEQNAKIKQLLGEGK